MVVKSSCAHRSRKRSSPFASPTMLMAVLLLAMIPVASSNSAPYPLPITPRGLARRPIDLEGRPLRFGPPSKRDSGIPLKISNNCGDTIWPAIASQAGTGPGTGGFELAPGTFVNLTVGADWQGRVWGRTNCSFNPTGDGPSGSGRACVTGDCNSVLNCVVTGDTPVTLAEFDLSGGVDNKQTYYDLSLVDGYNLPIGLTYIPGSDPALQDIPPNLTNAACIATSGLLSSPATSGLSGNSSNGTYPIPYESKQTSSSVAGWCPWDLQQTPPTKPGDGVYPYPDDNIQRPIFDPCLSACAKTNSPSDCCTGSHDSPNSCSPGLYSRNAKAVCPDAYSYAYDDTTSTFIIPSGGGWEVTFCPAGRSTNILKTLGPQLSALGYGGAVTKAILDECQNVSYIESGATSAAGERSKGEPLTIGGIGGPSLMALVVVVAWAVML